MSSFNNLFKRNKTSSSSSSSSSSPLNATSRRTNASGSKRTSAARTPTSSSSFASNSSNTSPPTESKPEPTMTRKRSRTTTTESPQPSASVIPSSTKIDSAHSKLDSIYLEFTQLLLNHDHHTSISELSFNTKGKLDYSIANQALHSYIERLTKLLLQLDGVDSYEDEMVRKRRKELVKEIDHELEAVEQRNTDEWNRRKEVEPGKE